MQYDFDEIIDRRNTNAMAKDGFRPYLFADQPPVVLPCPDDEALSMWVADMAFGSAPAARSAMVERIESHPILGYSSVFEPDFTDAFAAWCERRYQWRPDRDHVVPSSGIVPALYALAEIFLEPGEAAITLTPAYGYFSNAPTQRNRRSVTCALVADDSGGYRVDLDDFASKVADPTVKMFYLCYPHNPTGTCFTEDELRSMAELCVNNDVLIISDEIHCDLLRDGVTHTPLAKLLPDNDRIITTMSASKTFNLAGLGFALVIISDPELRRRWNEHTFVVHNPISVEGTIGAFRDGEEWHAQLTTYLDANFAYLAERLAADLPEAKFAIPDATYLAWIDLRSYFPAGLNLTRYFAEAEGLLLEGGDMFVADGDGHVRLNLACPRSMLADGTDRLVRAVQAFTLHDGARHLDEVSALSAKDLSRSQFGANAANYATSAVHAKGASLGAMVTAADPQPSWRALDIATAAGHTAFAFAPHVKSVIATDLTPEMVELAAERAAELGLANVTTQLADAELLPFGDETFEVVTCRIAPHHFPNPDVFISEVARVLAPEGVFVIVDNIVPDDQHVAGVYNAWEKKRDPSHVRALSLGEWVGLCEVWGLSVRTTETAAKKMSFEAWVNNMNVPEELRPELLDELLGADDDVASFLQPQGTTEENAKFTLTEGLIVATKK